jgi:hypothetical protein
MWLKDLATQHLCPHVTDKFTPIKLVLYEILSKKFCDPNQLIKIVSIWMKLLSYIENKFILMFIDLELDVYTHEGLIFLPSPIRFTTNFIMNNILH